MIFYSQAKSTQGLRIPEVIVVSYSLIGAMLTTGAYLFFHNSYYHIGASKKHTVRCWKAIHAIRMGFKNLFPEISNYLIMPDSKRNPQRPRLSKRWEQGIFIYPFYHLMFYVILALMISPLFGNKAESEKPLIPEDGIEIFIKALTVLWPFLIFRLATGCDAMRRFWCDIKAARIMKDDNIFPNERESIEENVDSHRVDEPYKLRVIPSTPLRKFVWWGHFTLVLISIVLTYDTLLEKGWFAININSPTWKLTLCIFIVLAILGELLYLKTHNLRILVRIGQGGIKFEI
jgi:hypothetical protein